MGRGKEWLDAELATGLSEREAAEVELGAEAVTGSQESASPTVFSPPIPLVSKGFFF